MQLKAKQSNLVLGSGRSGLYASMSFKQVKHVNKNKLTINLTIRIPEPIKFNFFIYPQFIQFILKSIYSYHGTKKTMNYSYL